MRVDLLIGNGLLLLLDCFLWPENVLRIREHEIKPHILLDLLDHVRERLRHDALHGVVVLGEGLEEGDDTLGNTRLLAFFMDVSLVGVEEKYLGVRELLFVRFFYFGF